ncbi:phosphatase PAP2 family protein [Fluviispira multicolorata]|uniref:Phosphatase PAP2 family protein n=1 Tax=Fluviispira multicolorata TaxID=2654512 RepID=A0A833N4U2_9BACT|nr:phosphatase PAP2 family protein [Fluviispira multicolorata]KAB8031793.1 phosphatase PAP2 family protein [Fluviispira multicolorata]
MLSKKLILNLCVSSLVFFFVVLLSIFYLDRELVFILKGNIIANNFLKELNYIVLIPPVLFVISPFLIFIILLKYIYTKSYIKLEVVLVLSAMSVLISTSIKSILKFIFSRDNIYMLTHSNSYKFHWFKDEHSWSSFPSGHAVVMISATTLFWYAYPRYRLFYILFNILVMLALLLLSFHFISDLIGSIFFGYWISYFTYCVFSDLVKKKYF